MRDVLIIDAGAPAPCLVMPAPDQLAVLIDQFARRAQMVAVVVIDPVRCRRAIGLLLKVRPRGLMTLFSVVLALGDLALQRAVGDGEGVDHAWLDRRATSAAVSPRNMPMIGSSVVSVWLTLPMMAMVDFDQAQTGRNGVDRG